MEKPARLEYFGTLGPACADPDILTELFEAGMTGGAAQPVAYLA